MTTKLKLRLIRPLAAVFGLLALAAGPNQPAAGATISFQTSDFGLTQTKNTITAFDFEIVLVAPLAPGVAYNNPSLTSVNYTVTGLLPMSTPSGFGAFNLVRSISGSDFYAQGSSLMFAIAPTADMSDGLQVNELMGPDPVFLLNAREVGTGRYHPPLLELNANGTGLLQNSNNSGGENPSSGEIVDVDFGDEYITGLAFDPAALTLAAPVPLPAGLPLFLSGLVVLGLARRYRR